MFETVKAKPLANLNEAEIATVQRVVCRALHGQPSLLDVLQRGSWHLEVDSKADPVERRVCTPEGMFVITRRVLLALQA